MGTHRSVRSFTIALALLVLGLLAGTTPAAAQDSSVPPWPLLFRGTVLLDGAPVSSGQLRVRVGDWESKPVPVVDGTFVCLDPCLVAGPPALSYIGQTVSFHLDEAYLGDVTFPFPASATPQQLEVDLLFSRAITSAPLPTGSPDPGASDFAPDGPAPGPERSWRWPLLLLAGIAITGLGTGAWEWRKRARRSSP
jgi:hypothetical protein